MSRKIALLIFCLLAGFPLSATVTLPRVISNSMVLQRDKKIHIWGWADPGEKVTLRFIQETRSVTADSNGSWSISLPKMEPGGPYRMEINDLVIEDIMIGDVWLFSGQSNIELQVRRVAIRYPHEVTAYTNTNIREFRTRTDYAFDSPKKDLSTGQWTVCTPENAREFSALGYFFAKNLYEKYQIPIGLIVNAVGGSPLDAWLDEATLRTFPGPDGKDYYEQTITRLKQDGYVDSVKQAEQANAAKFRSFFTPDPGIDGLSDKWTPYHVPSFWNQPEATPSGPFSIGRGSVWFKKEFYLTKEQLLKAESGPEGSAGTLILGTMVDSDLTYLNKKEIGFTAYQYPPRIYNVPKGLLKEGKNEILIKMENLAGPGGFTQDKDYTLYLGVKHPFYDGAGKIALAGDSWYAQKGSELSQWNIDFNLHSSTTWHYQPTGLYNALLAPLAGYTVKGAVWYQGESSIDRRDYAQMLRALIMKWREDFGDKRLPFIVVQLPNFMKDSEEWPVESQWAWRRDEQRLAVQQTKHTALAVALDLGEWNDIHPLNKKDLAQRVAACAEYLAYGNKKAPLSPVPDKVYRRGKAVVITFRHAGEGLMTKDGSEPLHFAVSDHRGIFHRAKAVIKGRKKIIVRAPDGFTPVSVRYAWGNNPVDANLQSKAGWPVSPFQVTLNNPELMKIHRDVKDERGKPVPWRQGARETGRYRNLFLEAGYSLEEIDAKLSRTYYDLFEGPERVYFQVEDSLGYVSDLKNFDVRTEGMSYGMMIAVQWNKKDVFDRLWRWSKRYMQHKDGPRKGYFAWSVDPVTGKQNSEGSASDGELYYVTALLFASNRWGNDTGIDYYADARALLDAMFSKDGTGGIHNIIDTAQKKITFTPDGTGYLWTDPSYFLPAFYEVWAEYAADGREAFYRTCADTARVFLHRACDPFTGLNTDLTEYDGLPKGSHWLPAAFRYDSWRVPMNIAMDYSWYAKDSEWQEDYARRFQDFLYFRGLDRFEDQFNPDGTLPSVILQAGGYRKLRHSLGLVATSASVSLMGTARKSWKFVDALWNARLEPYSDGYFDPYYDGLLYLFGLMHLSGNYRIIDK